MLVVSVSQLSQGLGFRRLGDLKKRKINSKNINSKTQNQRNAGLSYNHGVSPWDQAHALCHCDECEFQPCKRTALESSYRNQNHNHNPFTVCPSAQTLNSVQWLIQREWPEALAMCIYSHINMFKMTLKAWSTSRFVRCIQWSCNTLLSRNDSFVNLFLTFIWMMAKKVLFYVHYVVFPTIFFHLLGALPGNTVGHNSVLEGNSDDEPYFCKDSLTLICHMWSLCVRLKMVVQVCVPEQAHRRTPSNHGSYASQSLRQQQECG